MIETKCKCSHLDIKHRGEFNRILPNNEIHGLIDDKGSCEFCDCKKFEPISEEESK